MWKFITYAGTWRQILETEIGILLATLVWGQALRLPTTVGDVSIIGLDVVMGVIVASWMLAMILVRVPLWEEHYMWGIYALIGAILFSWIANGNSFTLRELIVSTAYAVRLISYWLLPVITLWTFRKSGRLRLARLMLGASGVFVVFGLVQYVFFQDFHSLQNLGWDPHLYRLAGTLFDPGFSGLWICMAILMLIGTKKWTKNLLVHDGLLLLLCVGLALTFSRASYLAVSAGLIVLLCFGKQLKTIILTIFIVAIAILLAPKPGGEGVNLARQSTVNLRVHNWQQAIHVIESYPVFGVGYNRYRYVARSMDFLPNADWERSHAGAGIDNSVLFIAATMGVLGIFIWTGWFGYLFVRAGKSLRQDKTKLSAVALASLVAWGVHGMFHNSLFYAPALVWMGLLLGMVGGEHQKS